MASNSIKGTSTHLRPSHRPLHSANFPQSSLVSGRKTKSNSPAESRDGGGGAFTFDRVFDMACRQSDVFDFSIRPTVDDILNGYNGTVFAYGQTGAGKSYTMMGSDIGSPDHKGVIPRITEQIFASIMASESNIEYTVRVSYMEIYMERIRDLLVPQNDNLPIHEEKNRGVYVKGLMEVYVSSVDEVYQILERGGMSRAVAATNMNQESSRSHSIFVITVGQKNVETGSVKSGQLFLVDLAGSEKVGKTGASGQTLEEAKKINKSLSALGMVINALTDGKSSHVPYRDSKLTRILQESLGGNSRTTLIINCSPSSFNDSETVSTLRFGMRAKSIKNKAKVNQELSPAELKALLRKAQSQVSSFETYISNLESEVGTWRKGQAVPKEQWTPTLKDGPVRSAPRPATPSLLGDQRKGAETPTSTRPDSRMDLERAGTPTTAMDKDEREEFLRRENELQDQLAEKESVIATTEKALQDTRQELRDLRETHGRVNKDNEKLAGDVEGLKMQVERITFETKEESIMMDSLKEANNDLSNELDELRKELLEAKMNARETSAVIDEKEKLKKERMAQMMAGFDLGDEVFSENERSVQEAIKQLDALLESTSKGEAPGLESLSKLRERLVETQGAIRQVDHSSQGGALEHKLLAVQKQYEELLQTNLSEADVEDVKRRLQESLASHTDGQTGSSDLNAALARQQEENLRMRSEVEALRRQTVNGANGAKSLHQQLADFDAMKKSLMRDLQNRCERVVELEISLDSTREQYNSVLRSANSKQQQKKLAFLERNLEQLTQVQRQLVEQNAQLKKEVAIADRKLAARGERIHGLEQLLGESQEKLMQANHRFEAQLTAVKERLEAAKVSAATRNGNINVAGGAAPNGFGSQLGSRIAKPLRGGGGEGPMVPTLAGLQQQQQQEGPKRSSWFFNQRT
ncbi:kinesin-domain-containing protein [Aureobasidium pullulans]|uniref:Kinesin-like protein n=1 Tax=Aureobasidium pullulans TaxID=5580 RepID=A0A4S9BPX7_AURPU|nr:kinesin-domain-containing protein [Aureobasidium pullulans]